MELWLILLGWLLFGGTHIALGGEPARSFLVGKLGPGPFMGVFSLVALAAFGFLINAYWESFPAGEVVLGWGADSPVTARISEVVGGLAFVLLFTGFFNRTPMSIIKGDPAPYGITRVTRHPMNMAFALFAIGHLLSNRYAGDWIFWGGFILYGYVGSIHQDGKLARRAGGRLDEFVATTSVIPFAAILAGRQSLKLGEISKPGILLGIAAAVAIRLLHP